MDKESSLKAIFNSPSNIAIFKKIEEGDYKPARCDWFRCFDYCLDPRVIVIGKHPSKDGLPFSDKDSDEYKVISKALVREFLPWNKQNINAAPNFLHEKVLFLNAFTYRGDDVDSDLVVWRNFIQQIINFYLGKGIIFLRWGKYAQSFEIDHFNENVLDSYWPSAELIDTRYKFFSYFKRAEELVYLQSGEVLDFAKTILIS